MATTEEAIQSAWQLVQAGRVPEAELVSRQLLAQAPSHPDALFLLAVTCQVQGKLNEAVTGYERCLAIRPDHVEACNNLGAIYAANSLWEQASSCYRRALQLRPDYADACNNLALALINQCKPDEAEPHLRHALKVHPGHAEAHNNLGLVRRQQGRADEAVASFREALRLKPQFAAAHFNLGSALQDRGRLDEAAAAYQHGLHLQPDYSRAHSNLGVVLGKQGKLNEAVASYRRALQIEPDNAEAFNNLGVALQYLGELDQAMECHRQAVQLKADYADAFTNLGSIFKEQGKLREAVDHYDKAIQCRPDANSVRSNRLVCLNYDPDISPELLFEEHRRWAEVQARPAATRHESDRDPDRRLRIGYLSPDFRRHAVAHFLTPLFAHHDRHQVEVFCYAEITAPDSTTAQLQARADGWRWTSGLDDPDVATQIRSDRIDLLVDLAGHTAGNRLTVLAWKPAPVQITYLGYPSTTGLATIDYRLTDAVADPPGEPQHHTEHLVRLPLMFCYQPPELAPPVSPLPALTSDCITFGSLNNLAKLNPQVLDLWCAVLRAVPSGRLLLFRNTVKGSALEHLRRQLIERGIAPDRFELADTVPSGKHYLSVYDRIDIALDPFPWSGHTTSCEALWMGAPVVTLYGNRYAGRMAACALTGLGMTQFIAYSADDYVAIAADWASRPDRLSQLRGELRGRMQASPLCDGKSFTRALEQTYRDLWRRWCTLAV
jgi:predicted O-linked N-acetylglucosamine transferase (SPINDLY family)